MLASKKSAPNIISSVNRTAAGTPRRGELNRTTNLPIREVQRERPRPISVSGIPSPTPTRSNTLHVRKDKYGSPSNDAHRRSFSLRSFSATAEKLNFEKTQAGVNPAGAPGRSVSKTNLTPKSHSDKPITITEEKGPRSSANATVHTRQSSRDTTTSTRTGKMTSPSSGQKLIKTKSSRDLLSREPRQLTIKTQRSKEFSPAPSSQSSPRFKARISSASHIISDLCPDQVRLLQLLHLVPLSKSNLIAYETSGHRILSARYSALQIRFQKIQRHDHVQVLTETLGILKSWSDGQIKALSTLLVDWDSITMDLRSFCKRLTNTLKPVNKSVIEEKGFRSWEPE
jgi:hypothetical protein